MNHKSRYLPVESSSSARLERADLNRLVSLKTKKGRRKEELFLAEGVRLLEEALRHRQLPRRLFLYPPDINERSQALVESFRSKRVPTETISSRDFHRLVETKSPQGLLGVFNLPSLEFDFQQASQARRVLVVENINDPGNLGALIRSALGFGFDLTLLVGDCVEPFNAKVIRSTAGTVFGCRMMTCNLEQIRSLIDDSGLRLLVTDVDGEPEEKWFEFGASDSADSSDSTESQEEGSLAVAVGAESIGASSELREMSYRKLRISQSPLLESLNASIAGSIVMHRLYVHDSKL
ncbi:RNA methyltransferase [bacterium AH-315-J21]|nr:RNA methyltransferase [bacterium AH-315-J21]